MTNPNPTPQPATPSPQIAAITKKPLTMTPELVLKLYSVMGITPPKDRALNRVVIIVEAGKPVTIEERAYPVSDTTPEESAKIQEVATRLAADLAAQIKDGNAANGNGAAA